MDRSTHKKPHPGAKKALRRVDTEIVRRIVILLHEHGKERKTKMALKTHLSYDKCLRYLEWLELMGFVKREGEHDGSEFINLTQSGNDLYSQYINLKNIVQNIEHDIPTVGINISSIEDS